MCGISGIIDFKTKLNKDQLRKSLVEMNKSLNHRGPDDNGVWVHDNKSIGLSQTRLSIIDLSSSGHQPMIDKRNGNVITFNGEIFNYQDINSKHLSDEDFNSTSDTETILKLFNKQGISMFDKMNGMFAFAIWDERKNEILLARDRSGKKPLYYVIQDGVFVFSSEIKSILTLPWIKKEFDQEAFYHFLTFGLLPDSYTMFKGIHKFDSGSYMVIKEHGIEKQEEYWRPAITDYESVSENDLKDIVFSQFNKSVKERMISDVPVGAFLSGGVDSSAIVALMAQNTNEEIKTFTIGFDGQPKYDELKSAEKISKIFNTKHFTKIVTKNDIIEFLPKIVDIFDEPIADTTLIPINFISQLAKEEGIKVVLTGDGADELFNGYKKQMQYFQLEPFYRNYIKLPKFIKRLSYEGYSLFSDGGNLYDFLNRALNNQQFFWGHAGGIKESQKMSLFSDDFRNSVKNYDSYSIIQGIEDSFRQEKWLKEPDFVKWMTYISWKLSDTNKYLFRADRIGMAHSIETRAPFLDYEMVELAMSLPSKYKIKDNIPKYILKKSFEKILDKDVLYRKKQGFNLPFREWAVDTFVKEIEDNLDFFKQEFNILNINEIEKYIIKAKGGDNQAINILWILYFMILWYKKWIL